MNAVYWVILGLIALSGLYLWLIAPALKRPDDAALHGWLYAHRGFHNDPHLAPENSMEAFRRAVEGGYGIELDVQRTKDDQLVVFHDESLKRVLGVDRRVFELTRAELDQYPLPNGEVIPLFSDVLTLVNGRVPLIVEIKYYDGVTANAAAALEQLRAYKGAYCVESFHPMAMRHFKKNAPNVIRGQLAFGYVQKAPECGRAIYFVLKYLLVNVLSRPHFIAYSVPEDRTFSMRLMKSCFHPLLAAWTIRDQQLLNRVLDEYDFPIFEQFAPCKKYSSSR